MEIEVKKAEFEAFLREGEEYVPTQIYIAAGAVLFTTFLLLLIGVFKKSISITIVLTWLSGGGKTLLFYQLRDGSSHHGTVTSMEPNEGLFLLNPDTSKKGKINLVDVPGHSRLVPKLDEYLPRAAGIVFVVDAVEYLPNSPAASE